MEFALARNLTIDARSVTLSGLALAAVSRHRHVPRTAGSATAASGLRAVLTGRSSIIDQEWQRIRRLQKYLINPPFTVLAHLGVPGYHAIIETTGRRTGRRRRTVVGVHREGDTVWIVAEHGRRAGYVCNIGADPRVRLRLGRRWLTGRAELLPEDDAQARLDGFGLPGHAQAVRRFATAPLTLRVQLDGDR
ncbi:deazaflavin-dependent oxidoreductase, nitroreductase family [Microlunatus soli]|uniref:Deazaflavin-dependent oxidoreductase, nitroreductase family n=1 Tax=Microlunatus soli TaxID=630515 RepID=A0A1H1XGC1_9ACTN|nr:deazaflavin-dependent oxidoreductase, nitroreductase family [Microlunatus soli]